MASLDDIRNVRLAKRRALIEAGMMPYPARTTRTHAIGDTHASFADLSKEKKRVTLAGRVMAKREHGGSAFLDLFDGTGSMQLFFTEEKLGEAFSAFSKFVDIGDFIEVEGIPFTTKRGERTIEAAAWAMLAKSIRSLPEKWHGLADTETRLRLRYLDMLVAEDTRDLVLKRSKFFDVMRTFMSKRGFLEVETPILEAVPGGADARPFKTHYNALDIDVYLRISAGELWQKRLMVAGFPKVFEIGRVFRNEGESREHLQDYTAMEFYWAYADYEAGMTLVEELYRTIASEVFGTLSFKIGDFSVDLEKPWARYDFASTLLDMAGIDPMKASERDLKKKLGELGVEYGTDGFNKARGIDALWKHCRRQIAGPGFLTHVPVFMEPLAKRSERDQSVVERFQVILAGSEMGKGYSELNDPVDQRERFSEQQELRDAGDDEAQRMDEEFIEALEYGMPPTCGFGVSERLFSFLMNRPARETQLFPILRPKNEK